MSDVDEDIDEDVDEDVNEDVDVERDEDWFAINVCNFMKPPISKSC